MTHIEKQLSYCLYIDQLGQDKKEGGLQSQLLDATKAQFRLIANQIYARSRYSEGSSSSSGESVETTVDQNDKSNDEQSLSGSEEESDPEFTLPSYTETSEEWSLSGSAKESGLTLPSYIEMDRDERSLLEERSESTVSSYMELNEDEGDQAKDDGRSEITLPSYTEMCGDEDSLAQRGQNVEEEDINDEEIIHGSDIIDDSNVAMPGCFGDCMVGNQLPQDIRLPRASSLKNYRYIGKRRPNYDEFETTPESRGGQGYREESRVPPAESTAVDVHIFINKWLKDSDGKTAAERRDLKFPYHSDVKKTCRNVLPRLSSSSIELSSRDCRNRKRKLAGCEIEAVTGSRSETDISRPQPRRNIKTRKLSSH